MSFDSKPPSKAQSLKIIDDNQNNTKRKLEIELSVQKSKQNPGENSINQSELNESNIEKKNLLQQNVDSKYFLI